jgi:hypothetical protein
VANAGAIIVVRKSGGEIDHDAGAAIDDASQRVVAGKQGFLPRHGQRDRHGIARP